MENVESLKFKEYGDWRLWFMVRVKVKESMRIWFSSLYIIYIGSAWLRLNKIYLVIRLKYNIYNISLYKVDICIL